MDFKVNGKPVGLRLDAEKTFGEVMATIYKKVVTESCVVTQLNVNGEALSEEREKNLSTIPRDDIATVEITTRHPLDLAHESMTSALDYVGRLMEAFRANARSLRLKDSKSVGPDFQVCVEGLRWFFDLIMSLRGPLHLADDEVISGDRTYLQVEQESIDAINQLCDARERADYGALSDALEYDLLPVLDLWRLWLLKKTDLEAAVRELESKTPSKS